MSPQSGPKRTLIRPLSPIATFFMSTRLIGKRRYCCGMPAASRTAVPVREFARHMLAEGLGSASATPLGPGHRKIRRTSLPPARTGHSVTEILHPTTFLEACVLLLYNCLNLSSQNRCTKDPVPMHEWLGSQIPDTAPYIEWLAIACSVMAVLFCAVLCSHGVLT